MSSPESLTATTRDNQQPNANNHQRPQKIQGAKDGQLDEYAKSNQYERASHSAALGAVKPP